jgi:hypothetical protein
MLDEKSNLTKIFQKYLILIIKKSKLLFVFIN